MKKKKIILTFGTRPEAIKMAPVYFALKKDGAFSVKLVLTGQHTGMLDEALGVFSMKPEYNLNIMIARQSPAHITSTAVKKLSEVYSSEKPDLVLVHGDTSTTLSAALAAFYSLIPSAHVEAGLRTFVKREPFPEEMNRVLTDRIADILFPPTAKAASNIVAEGIKPARMAVTGNTIVDAVAAASKLAPPEDTEIMKLAARPLVLFTMHRRESWGAEMERVFNQMKKIFSAAGTPQLVFPVHPNPAVKVPAHKIFSGAPGIVLTKPLRYNELLFLLKKSLFVVTDSGGIQEEAAVFKKRTVLLRRYTERPEGVRAGFTAVVGTGTAKLAKETLFLLNNPGFLNRIKKFKNPYGDGRASDRIKSVLKKFLGLSRGRTMKDFN